MNSAENGGKDEAFLSEYENDADMFKSEGSSAGDEKKPDAGQQILDVFRQKMQKLEINEESKWYEFKENDGVTKMLERKVEEERREKERIEFENRKKVRKIMRNPVEYINLIKVYLMCSIYNIIKISKKMFSEQLQAYVLSKFSLQDIIFLEKLGLAYADRKIPMDFLIRDIFRVFSKFFVFKKFNASYLLYNLAFTNNYTHEQITWLFISLCQYLKIPVRFLSIVDLTCFNLDKKYRVNMKSIEEESKKKNIKKRKMEDFNEIPNNIIKKKKTEPNMIDKCIRSLIEKGDEPKESNFDELEDDCESKKSEEENIDLDNFLADFHYKKPEKSSNLKNIRLSESLKKKVPTNFDEVSNDLLDITSFNYDNFKKSAEKDKTRPIFSDSYDSDEYKYWIEIFDYELDRWIVVNPILQEIYKEVLPKYVQAKIHNIPALFILSSFRPLAPIDYKIPDYIFKSSEIFLADSTIRYCEKWTKTLIHRRQLTLKFWWDQDIISKLDLRKIVTLNPLQQQILDSEEKLNTEIFKSDIPTNYNEFRNSPYYILPSHIKKYQGLKPDAIPIPDMFFKEEPVYLRTDIVDLHTKSKWRTLGRKVKHGQQGIKKVLALTSDGEQMVDLYGLWQTEEFNNVLNEDGTLPKNEYGNYELFNGGSEKIPEGTVHVDLPFINKLCKKYEIEYVDTVVGTFFYF